MIFSGLQVIFSFLSVHAVAIGGGSSFSGQPSAVFLFLPILFLFSTCPQVVFCLVFGCLSDCFLAFCTLAGIFIVLRYFLLFYGWFLPFYRCIFIFFGVYFVVFRIVFWRFLFSPFSSFGGGWWEVIFDGFRGLFSPSPLLWKADGKRGEWKKWKSSGKAGRAQDRVENKIKWKNTWN